MSETPRDGQPGQHSGGDPARTPTGSAGTAGAGGTGSASAGGAGGASAGGAGGASAGGTGSAGLGSAGTGGAGSTGSAGVGSTGSAGTGGIGTGGTFSAGSAGAGGVEPVTGPPAGAASFSDGAEQTRADRGRGEQARADQGRGEQARTDRGRAEEVRFKPGRAGQQQGAGAGQGRGGGRRGGLLGWLRLPAGRGRAAELGPEPDPAQRRRRRWFVAGISAGAALIVLALCAGTVGVVSAVGGFQDRAGDAREERRVRDADCLALEQRLNKLTPPGATTSPQSRATAVRDENSAVRIYVAQVPDPRGQDGWRELLDARTAYAEALDLQAESRAPAFFVAPRTQDGRALAEQLERGSPASCDGSIRRLSAPDL